MPLLPRNPFFAYLTLLRPKEWVKNCFLFIPFFFAASPISLTPILALLAGFVSFSMVASGVYVLNDLRDLAADQRHPVKKNRPLAAGLVSRTRAIGIMVILWSVGLAISYYLKPKFCFVLGLYFLLNLAYSLGLKNISVLDMLLVSAGFVLRVKAGGALTSIPVSTWLTIMIFLISLLMVIAKRRDDVVLRHGFVGEVRKASMEYNLEYLNIVLGLIAGITIVAYLMYTISPEVIARHNSYRLYYTCIFVVAGVLRYLQITFVENKSGSPTNVLYQDRFIQVSLLLWILSFCFVLYAPDFKLFNQ